MSTDDRENNDPTLPEPTGYEWPRLVPEPEPEHELLVAHGDRYVEGLRLLVAYLLTACAVVPLVVISFAPGEWFGALVTAVGLFVIAAGVSVFVDSVES